MINSVSAVKRVGRWLWLTAALLIIGTVILVVIGRQIIPRIDELRVAIETALRVARACDCEQLLVMASTAVIERLLDEDSAQVADLEEFIGRSIQFRAEDLFAREQFDIIPL